MNHKDTDSMISAASLFVDTIRQSFRLQNTIAQSVFVRGFGFWTGEDVEIEFRPALPDTGLVFVRTDLPGSPRIPALVSFREEKPRQTSLVAGDARVDMVEHLIAALRGLKIDNCEIRTNRSEMPGFDGSSLVFVQNLDAAGIVPQPAVRKVRLVTQSFCVGHGDQQIRVLPNRHGVNSYHYTLVPGEGYEIEEQDYGIELTPEAFRREIMSSRTFLAKHEADYLLKMGLCTRVTPKDVLVLTAQGPLENEYRFPEECARHKVLDMVGDFALTDCDWIGSFRSYRGGHALNAECVKELLEKTLLLDDSCVSHRSAIMAARRKLLEKAA